MIPNIWRAVSGCPVVSALSKGSIAVKPNAGKRMNCSRASRTRLSLVKGSLTAEHYILAEHRDVALTDSECSVSHSVRPMNLGLSSGGLDGGSDPVPIRPAEQEQTDRNQHDCESNQSRLFAVEVAGEELGQKVQLKE